MGEQTSAMSRRKAINRLFTFSHLNSLLLFLLGASVFSLTYLHTCVSLENKDESPALIPVTGISLASNGLRAAPNAADVSHLPQIDGFNLDSNLEPLQVLQQYKDWHSVQSLQENPHNRSFAIGFYSCPLQAGNRLHHFFNSVRRQ
jgi:hypothetical protein